MSRPPRDPRRRDRTRPAELLGISGVVAVVVGAVVFFAMRGPDVGNQIETALLWAGLTFIVVVVVMAMLVLASSPETRKPGERDEEPRGH